MRLRQIGKQEHHVAVLRSPALSPVTVAISPGDDVADPVPVAHDLDAPSRSRARRWLA
jgi:hypothetical protein